MPGLVRENVQLAPASFTVSVWPAIVMVPVRAAAVTGWRAKVRLTEPEPLPAPVPLARLIHESTCVVFQAQPVAEAFTAIGPLAARRMGD